MRDWAARESGTLTNENSHQHCKHTWCAAAATTAPAAATTRLVAVYVTALSVVPASKAPEQVRNGISSARRRGRRHCGLSWRAREPPMRKAEAYEAAAVAIAAPVSPHLVQVGGLGAL